MQEVLDPDALDHRGMLVHYPHPLFGEVRSVGPPFSMDNVHPSYRRAPELGSDTLDILQELGFDRAEIQALRDAGAL
jgi:crotonobetainyl-CoA:carnitine CoA-transferase CaiB-like acyl-CoA transferase